MPSCFLPVVKILRLRICCKTHGFDGYSLQSWRFCLARFQAKLPDIAKAKTKRKIVVNVQYIYSARLLRHFSIIANIGF